MAKKRKTAISDEYMAVINKIRDAGRAHQDIMVRLNGSRGKERKFIEAEHKALMKDLEHELLNVQANCKHRRIIEEPRRWWCSRCCKSFQEKPTPKK